MTDQEKRARLHGIFRDAKGVIAPGVTDALFARLVEDCGYPAAHLSGNAIHKNFCLPDRNLLTVTQIAQRVGQIAEESDIPLIVDGGTVCLESAALARMVKSYERAGAAAIRVEDSLVNEYGAPAEELAIAPLSVVVDRIKAAADARTDRSMVLIGRCDARPKESLDQVCERLAAYAEAGANAVGVQLDNLQDFRDIGAKVKTPLVSLWPKSQMSAMEFFRLGFCVALIPSSVPLAAIGAAREMLLELKRSGTDHEYFARQNTFAAAAAWYKQVGSMPKQN